MWSAPSAQFRQAGHTSVSRSFFDRGVTVNRVTKTAVLASIAIALAVVLARIDFSASGQGANTNSGAVASAEFSPDEIRIEALLTVAPVDDAIAFFEQRAEANPASYIDRTLLTDQYLRKARDLGDSESITIAEEAILEALAINPNYPAALASYANVLATTHRFEEAIEWASKVPQRSSSYSQAIALKGDAYLALGDYEEAGRLYSELSVRAPGAASLSRQAHFAYLNGDSERAIELANTAAAAAYEFGATSYQIAWHLSAIGEFLLAEGQADEALDMFTAAYELAPGHVFALAGLGHSRWMTGDLNGSAEIYEKALKRIPGDTGLMTELASVYAALGRSTEADALTKAALEDLTADGQPTELVRREVAQLLADNGNDTDQAVALARQEVESRRDVHAYDLLAWALYQDGQFSEALIAIETALSLGTKDASFYYHAGLIYLALGMEDDARQALEKVQEINPNFALGDAEHAKQLLAELE